MTLTIARKKLLIGFIVIILCLVIAATVTTCLLLLKRAPDQPTTLASGTNSSTNHTNDDQSTSTEPTTVPETKAAITTATTTTITTTTTTKPTTKPITKPAIEPTTKPITEPTTEPTTKPTTEPATKPTTEPATKPITEPATKSTTETTTKTETTAITTTSFFTSIATKPDPTALTTPNTKTMANSNNTTDITSIKGTTNIVSTTDITNTASTIKMGTTMFETTSKNENLNGLLCTKDLRGMDYRGNVSVTSSGRTCQRWDKQVPHSHANFDQHFPHDGSMSKAENYCRSPTNPLTAEDQPWCYTTALNTRWEHCSIPKCPLSSLPTSTTSTSCASSYMPIHANSTATPMIMVSLLKQTDPIVALCNTVPGGYSLESPTLISEFACRSPRTEELVNAILDGDLESKHVNNGHGSVSESSPVKGVGTGFIVVPQTGGLSVLQAFQFGTGDDYPGRDPITITIEASQFSTNPDLQFGSSWNLIYDGWTGISMTNDSGRNAYGSLQNISHPCPYKAYRVLIASQRGVANCVQYSEVRFFGYFIN